MTRNGRFYWPTWMDFPRHKQNEKQAADQSTSVDLPPVSKILSKLNSQSAP